MISDESCQGCSESINTFRGDESPSNSRISHAARSAHTALLSYFHTDDLKLWLRDVCRGILWNLTLDCCEPHVFGFLHTHSFRLVCATDLPTENFLIFTPDVHIWIHLESTLRLYMHSPTWLKIRGIKGQIFFWYSDFTAKFSCSCNHTGSKYDLRCTNTRKQMWRSAESFCD